MMMMMMMMIWTCSDGRMVKEVAFRIFMGKSFEK
jgi:hypothetical protein